MDASSLGEAFESFEHDALRLEGLSAYDVDVEAGARRAVTEGRIPDMSFLDEWLHLVRNNVTTGKTHRRVRILDTPLTQYERFEIDHGYSLTTDAGEMIRTLPRSQVTAIPDCWIFDHQIVFKMNYDDAGRFGGAVRVDDAQASALISDVEGLWQQARPLK